MYTPSPKMAQLAKIASNRKWKTISPLRFKKSNYDFFPTTYGIKTVRMQKRDFRSQQNS